MAHRIDISVCSLLISNLFFFIDITVAKLSAAIVRFLKIIQGPFTKQG